MPEAEYFVYNLQKSLHKHVNNFDLRLLSLCKEHDLQIVNGRKDDNLITCYSLIRERTGASLVEISLL